MRGEGPPLVLVPGWLCHVEHMWTHPSAASSLAKLSRNNTFLWYDRLGCGRSSRDGFEISLENDVAQLAAVLDAAGLRKASLIGYSLGGPVAAEFACRFPERVEQLVFFSTFARGTSVAKQESHDALKGLIRANWALGSRSLATLFLPNGTGRDLNWFARFQRLAAEAEMAATLLDHMRTIDVSDTLSRIDRPALVLHNRIDPAISLRCGEEVARALRQSTLTVLEGNEHDPFIRDSGTAVEAILGKVSGQASAVGRPQPLLGKLTRREFEILRLVGEGHSNKEIARLLGITIATVERHVANIYGKLDARGRADAVLAAVSLGLVAPTSIS